MSAKPECPGCGRNAPPPASDEASEWLIRPDDELGPIALCPQCSTSDETWQRVVDEARRHNLERQSELPEVVGDRIAFDKDALVFVGGKARVFADLTVGELRQSVAESEARIAQGMAWTDWYEGRIAHMRGES